MIWDILYGIVDGVIWLLVALLPPLPPSISTFVDGMAPRLVALAQGIPYSYLLPWGPLSAAAVALPAAWSASVFIRLTRRVFAWVRSRGISDE